MTHLKFKLVKEMLIFILICINLPAFLYAEQNNSIFLNVDNNYQHMRVRLNDDRNQTNIAAVRYGRVEVSFNNGISWGTICSTQWSFREANVICRQLGHGFASLANQSTSFGNSMTQPWAMVGTLCRGTERTLADCFRESQYPRVCNPETNLNVAVVRCVPKIADLQLNLRDIQNSVRLQSVPLSRLTCAMEENCLARDAYEVIRTRPNARRDLLRFTTTAENVGNADFSPYSNFEEWEWHQCHQHYHSMRVFSTFNIYDLNYKKVADGHKASFCLMDSTCKKGISPKYTCGNSTQGISVGCSDIYGSGLDCQWVDVTNLPRNRFYILRLTVNPEYKLGEISFENNGAECVLQFTGNSSTTRILSCSRAPLWFRI